ncbi:MAG: polysaccharide pyruvyl transferase family protein [Bacteroidales bacterium]|nr:polysaccharide pyruvyl transferase family protein [Bacteroidales bacterium]
MKIGILTFHWATNYGAVLQTYALQTYLQDKGYDVQIINYKPASYDLNFLTLFRHPSWLFHLKKLILKIRKEKLFSKFRRNYLILSKRLLSGVEVSRIGPIYDVVISGSDQVLNPSFALKGDRCPSGIYFLATVPTNIVRIAYAVSFGCKVYPMNAAKYAKNWIQSFDYLGVRESSGQLIAAQLGYIKPITLVPDPVILYGKDIIKKFLRPNIVVQSYICVYMLRRELILTRSDVVYIDDVHKPISIEEWLNIIFYSRMLITNSFHGMIVALLSHVPFLVSIEQGLSSGINDRFYTLLKSLNLLDCIVEDISNLNSIVDDLKIDWLDVDKRLVNLQHEGDVFLGGALSSLQA